MAKVVVFQNFFFLFLPKSSFGKKEVVICFFLFFAKTTFEKKNDWGLPYM